MVNNSFLRMSFSLKKKKKKKKKKKNLKKEKNHNKCGITIAQTFTWKSKE